jgi:hypothetical protein
MFGPARLYQMTDGLAYPRRSPARRRRAQFLRAQDLLALIEHHVAEEEEGY